MFKISTKICLNGDLGIDGRMYGGKMLFLMDEAAAVFAKIYTQEPSIVTRRFSAVEFSTPVFLGDILEFWADEPKRGTTSVSFVIKVFVAGVERFRADCVFVALDEQGHKKPIDWARADSAYAKLCEWYGYR